MSLKCMTADEVKAAKTSLGMSYEQLAKKMNVQPRTVMRWCKSGAGGIPSLLLDMLVKEEGKNNA